MRCPVGDQPGAGGKVRGIDFTQFVGADGRRTFGRLGVVADDRGSAADEVFVGARPPAVRTAPAHPLPQQDGADLTAFHPYSSFFGCLSQRIQTPLG